ncbi:hypothetical protein V6N11_070148 [Hibiscus sabdariffa]|uniref:Uncharacterized protein n=1 Tax=Hibiscus sabdariffa TaxID=183260 RepID=A0ABR2QE86_9ROSI
MEPSFGLGTRSVAGYNHEDQCDQQDYRDMIGKITMEINVINVSMLGKGCASDVERGLLPLPADPNSEVIPLFDESIHFGSDYRPTAKELLTTMIGVLELGVIDATGVQPMK